MLYAPEEGEGDSFYKRLQGIWKLQVTALVLVISQCVMGSNPTHKRIVVQGCERFGWLPGNAEEGGIMIRR